MPTDQNDLFADEVIEKLKERFQAWTDNELAEKLNIGRSTISSWRRRCCVPGRFTKVLEVGGPLALSNGMPYEHCSDLDKAAMQLSLVRLIPETAPKLNSSDETRTIGRGFPEALESHFSAARSDIEKGLAAGVRLPDFALYTLLGFELLNYK